MKAVYILRLETRSGDQILCSVCDSLSTAVEDLATYCQESHILYSCDKRNDFCYEVYEGAWKTYLITKHYLKKSS